MININDDIANILINSDTLDKRIINLAEKINLDYYDLNPLLICLLKGSIPFLAKLCEYITIPMEYDCLKASSYEGTSSTGKVLLAGTTIKNIENRHIIIIEDIIDTGLTLDAVIKYLTNFNPASLEIMTLLNKKSRRLVENITAKYVGFEIPDEFVVGFGLDYNEKYRNLPYIGILKKEIYQQ